MSLRLLSNASRTLSVALKEMMSILTTPLVPAVTVLQTNVNFVPTRIPRKRRFQMLAVALCSASIIIAPALFLFLWLVLPFLFFRRPTSQWHSSYPPLWPPLFAYQFWISFVDKSPENGGRSSQWLRSSKIWTYFADYYPASFIKEAHLPPDRPYVFGYHPHGIIGMGAVATFATEATGFSAAFPGIKPHLLTLKGSFKMPFYRDIILAMGACSVSRESGSNILKAGPGSAVTIAVGGAIESLSAHPGTADLTLRKRLGFIKLAIQNGADLVPVFSFGENDIFEQMGNDPGTTLFKLQQKFKCTFGFTFPLFYGRGFLNYNLGVMPYRRPIVSVIGRPIHVTQMENPSLEEMTTVQEQYIEELERIWHTYKDRFAKTRTRELRIID